MKQNVGPGEARNVGIKASDSEYLAFCDSDDYWMPDKLEKQLAFMAKKDVFYPILPT